MDEQRLISLFFERNEYAVIEIAKAYGKYCYKIAMNITNRREDAEEIVNDVYQRLWMSIPPENPRDLRAYLAKITRNLAYNRVEAEHADKRRAIGTLPFDELDEVLPADDEKTLDRLAIEEALKEFLASLDSNSRILFVKRYFYNEGLDELARLYKTTRGAVKTRLHRLRKELKRRLVEKGVWEKEL